MPFFYGASGLVEFYPEFAFMGAQSFPSQIFTLLKMNGKVADESVIPVNSLGGGEEAAKLAALFDRYGSDKAAAHDYTPIYCEILSALRQKPAPTILEIGLGTNNPNKVSTMGAGGKPGASLRAFRDFLPNAMVYGADVDTDILFTEERIKTAAVDQTVPDSFAGMTDALGCRSFDLIIDDGLHTTLSNLNTLIFALPSLNAGGYAVIEDIAGGSVLAWQIARCCLDAAKYEARLIRCVGAHAFVVKKRGEPLGEQAPQWTQADYPNART
jgi:hypothetical protein